MSRELGHQGRGGGAFHRHRPKNQDQDCVTSGTYTDTLEGQQVHFGDDISDIKREEDFIDGTTPMVTMELGDKDSLTVGGRQKMRGHSAKITTATESQIDLLDHCIFCLRKTTKQRGSSVPREPGSSSNDLNEMLRQVPRVQESSPSSSFLLTTFNRLWRCLQQDQDIEDPLGFKVREDVMFTRLPVICQFCADKLKCVGRLYAELMKEMKRLGTVVRESQFGGKYSWRAEVFEKTLMESTLEQVSIQATFEFLGRLGRENVDMNVPESAITSHTRPRDSFQKRAVPQEECSSSSSPTLSEYHDPPETKIAVNAIQFPTAYAGDTVMKDYEEYVSVGSAPVQEPDPLAETDLGNFLGNEMEDENDSDPDYVKSEEASESSSDDDDDEPDTPSAVYLVDKSSVKLIKKGNTQRSPAANIKGQDDNQSDPYKYITATVDVSTGLTKFICTLEGCGRVYSNKYNAKTHHLTAHKPKSGQSVVCDLCGKRMTCPVSLRKHKKRIHGSNPPVITCDLCKDAVPKRDLYNHVREHVGEDYILKCPNPDCPLTFTQLQFFARHVNTRKNCRDRFPDGVDKFVKTIHICEVCSYKSGSAHVLRRHLNEEHENETKGFPCPISGCERRFTFKQSVALHLTQHDFCSSVSSQRCDLCNKHIKLGKMEEHLTTSHQAKETIKCHQCSFLFSTREWLIEHLFDHRHSSLTCDICNDEVKYSMHAQLRAHYFEVHKIGQKYSCEQCENVYWSKSNLLDHKHLKHNDGDFAKLPAKLKTIFKCNDCDSVYKSKRALLDHKTSVHGAGPCRHRCRFCGEMFSVKSVFVAHEREHKGLSAKSTQHVEWKCEVEGCGKVFKSKHKLKQHHSVTHLNERHVCEECGKSYCFASALKSHKESAHLGLRKHVCESCGESFASQSVLKRHKIIHSEERPFSCEICGQRFRHSGVLKTHVKAHERKGSSFKPNGPMKQIRKRVQIKKKAP